MGSHRRLPTLDFGSRDRFLDRRLVSRCVILVICQAACPRFPCPVSTGTP